MRRVVSVIQKSIDAETIVIRSEDGYDQQYEARPLVQARVKMRSIGDAAVLVLDGESQVADVAFLSYRKEAPARPRARWPDRDERPASRSDQLASMRAAPTAVCAWSHDTGLHRHATVGIDAPGSIGGR